MQYTSRQGHDASARDKILLQDSPADGEARSYCTPSLLVRACVCQAVGHFFSEYARADKRIWKAVGHSGFLHRVWHLLLSSPGLDLRQIPDRIPDRHTPQRRRAILSVRRTSCKEAKTEEPGAADNAGRTLLHSYVALMPPREDSINWRAAVRFVLTTITSSRSPSCGYERVIWCR